MYSKEDIDKLITNKCSLDEAVLIVQYLDEHPELLNEYFTITEWGTFKHDLKLSQNLSNKFWQNISENTINQKRTISLFRKLSIAASIALLIGLSWFSYKNLFNKNNNVIVAKIAIATKNIENKGNIPLFVTLPDSSIVELYPNSSISYQEKFTNHKRGVVLIGEAIFSVKKDKSSPFKVYSDSLVTTVLGTKFRVQSFNKENTINVVLYEGRVSVSNLSKNPNSSQKSYFLVPGNLLVYNKKSMKSEITSSTLGFKENLVVGKNIHNSNLATNNNWYMFNNQSLSEVFDQLSLLYNETIQYNKSDLKSKSFIGKIDKSDSLVNILKTIGLLNNLLITQDANGFHVSKK
jgi:ferric-dicitrate binding protein FerR (iron transport regulator)